MKSIKQRVAAFLLAVMMTVSGMPIEAFAAETTNSPPEEVESVLRLDNKEQPLETEYTTNEEVTKPEDTSSTTQDKPAIKEDATEESEKLDISEDKTSEDMDKQEAASDNTTEGDPEGTVTSKDGKTRITHFEINWVGDSNDTKVSSINNHDWIHRDIYKAELSWAISGERSYNPGQINITMTDKILIGEKEKYGFNKKDMPVPKAKLKEDGSIDYSADYGISDFVYIENDNNTFSLVNITPLNPGNHGNYTISYEGDYTSNEEKDTRYEFDSGDIGDLNSSISVLLDDGEIVKKDARQLHIKATKNPYIYVRKRSEKEMSWPSYLGDDLAPVDKENYMYIVYGIGIEVYGPFIYDLEIKDVIPKDQEIVGYTAFNSDNTYSTMWYAHNERLRKYKFSKPESNTVNVKFNDLFGVYNETPDLYRDGKYKAFIVTKVPKSIAFNGEEHTWKNTANVTAKTIEKNSQTLKRNSSTSISHQEMMFSAPTGNELSVEKMYSSLMRDRKYKHTSSINGAIDRILNDNNVDLEKWSLSGKSRTINLTYDSKLGDIDNEDAYGKKTYKHILSDDYLFLDDNLKSPLTNKDIEIRKLEFSVSPYQYQKNNGKYNWERNEFDENKTLNSIIYGKKTHDGEWIKLAEMDSRGRDFLKVYNGASQMFFGGGSELDTGINLPPGFIRVKAEIETNYHGLDSYLYVFHKVKPSKRVKKYAKIQNDKNQSMRLFNIGTLSVYDNDGKLIGIKGTTDKTPAVETTLKLDKKEFGEELFHDYDSVYLSGEIKDSKIKKEQNESGIRNDVNNKRFIVPWSVYVEEGFEGIKAKDFKGLQNGTFYDLLPKGATLNEKSIKLTDKTEYYLPGNVKIDNLKIDSYEVKQNFKNSGRDLLIVKYSGNLNEKSLSKIKDYKQINSAIRLDYETFYTWESYKDYGPKLRNYVAFESGNGKIANGREDKPNKNWSDEIKNAMTNLNPDHNKPAFLYTDAIANVSGNTIASTGLSKHIRAEKDNRYVLETSTKEAGKYSYRLRMASKLGTSTSNIIFYDSLEDYSLLKTDKDYGVKRWKGTLESVDVSQPISKGINPVVYYSTVPNLKIRYPDPKSETPTDQQENTIDLTDTSIWTTEKPKDLSKVTAIAVDVSKDKNGNPFVLKEEESVSIVVNMKAPWDMKKHRIDPEAKAINEIYANTTVTTNLDNVSENKIINTAYTDINLEPVETEATITAKKSYLDKEDKAIELKGDDFEFNLKDSNGKILQTKTNDKDGNITFDPIKYHSWDVGEHTYTIEEVKGKDNKIAYDKHIETVKVKVERPEVSEIKASVEYDKDGSNFINKEKKSASLQLVKLKANEEKFNLEEIKDKDGNLTSYKVPDADLGKTLDGAEYKLYKINDGKEELVATLTTKNGISNVVEELEAGSYKLVETKAPSGYHLAEDALKFEITDEDAGKLLAKFVTDKGIEDLPSTGGRGTKIFIGTGITLLGLMVGAMYVANKKKKQVTTK
ncbi:SpaA isopeptide-forming pilin-related protein [Finegoldia magna]|uniref:SpaA isopeptide-forming pilin-related protein n=1 Tax=Finegoldia magna TaxID=1260 RepID=UPI000B9189F7|nr:SpaA isopeptide-forming pilin-related protein [Finegoldia magna]OXZ40154.1 hypothetical protein B9N50_00955 [Finegoldia magna]